jgi:ABC-type uncharacterized transport system involved in gliding motility auxiliary subunit
MKSSLFILPFISLVLGALAAVIVNSFPEVPWVGPVSWSIAVIPVLAWVALDFRNFQRVFTRRSTKYGASAGVTVLVGFMVIAGMAYLAHRPRFNKMWDTTKSGANTLSDQTVKIVGKIAAESIPVTLTAYMQDEGVEKNFRDLMSLYLAKNDKLRIEYVDPRVDPTRAISEKIGSPNTLVVRNGDQEARITVFSEEKVTNALVKVLKARAKKIYFTKGHEESDIASQEPEGMTNAVADLKGNKYDVESISLLEQGRVPEDADLLVIAGPRYDFRAEEVRMIETFVKSGGALLAMIDAVVQVPLLSALIQKAGIQLEDDLLVLQPGDPRIELIGQTTALVGNFDKFSPVTKDYASRGEVVLLIPNARSVKTLATNEFELKPEIVAKSLPVIVRLKGIRQESDLKDLKNKVEKGEFGVIAVASGLPKKSENVAANETGNSDDKTDASSGIQLENKSGKERRVVVVGSVQFANNYGSDQQTNRDMFSNLVSYLLQDEDFISIRPRNLEKATLNVTSGTSQLLLMFLGYIYPWLFLVFGTYSWLRRRNA